MSIKAPISFCIIVKNEPLLEKCLLSIRDHVKEIVVIDTGSTDNITIQIAKKYADIFESYSGCNDPETGLIEDFADARNYSFSKATQPFVAWIDADDTLAGAENLIKITDQYDISHEDPNSAISIMFPYEYSYNELGQCTCLHYRERLFSSNKKFKFVNPVHEVAVPNDGLNTNFVLREDVIFKHQRQYGAKAPENGRNLRILRKYFEKVGDSDARQMYYLGLETFNAGLIDEAIGHLSKYIDVSGWDDERAMACLKLVDICLMKADYETGLKWAFKNIEIKETWGEGYFAAGKMFYFMANAGGPNEMRNWEKCIHFCRMGLNLPATKTLLFINPSERNYEIHRYLNHALNKLGDVQGALDSANIGLQSKPDDEALLSNKRLYETFLANNLAITSCNKLKDIGYIDNDSLSFITSLLNKQITVKANTNDSAPVALAPAPVPVNAQESIIPIIPTNDGSAFPVAGEFNDPKLWGIPTNWDFTSFPLRMSDNQLQAVVIMVWKQFMLHDEVLSAISFLENAPYNVRYSFDTQKALKLTKACLVWLDNKDDFKALNAPVNYEVEAGNPLPSELVWQEGNRFHLIADNLPPNTTLVDFGCMDGCFTNRYGMLGHKPTGLDACDTSIALANKKAKEFNTGAQHICTYFQDAIGKVPNNSFEYATSSDTYEHLRDPINDMLIPARSMLKEDGKFLLVTPHGSWMRGQYVELAHPWVWAKQGKSWLESVPRPHVVAPSVWTVADQFRQSGYWVKDSYVSLCSPNRDVEGQGNVFVEAHMKTPQNYDKGLDVVFFIGHGVEQWTPKSVETTGIGGSELMAIEMSKRLAKLGHKVRVYACSNTVNEGIYDGVEYRTTDKYQDLECDVLIVSRRADMLGDQYNIKAKLKLLWVHDVYAQSATNELLLKADKILALSEWHKQNLIAAHNLHPDHIVVTRNGIDLSRFLDKNIKRDKFKCINSSSPDRSWPILLEVWPRIKEQVPEATLTLAYGFKNWEWAAQYDKLQLDLIQRLKDQITSMKHLGVNYIDRVSQKQLAEEFLSAGCWAHSTWFTETSCITAMEAQAAGMRMVTSSIAALNETAGPRAILIDGEWTSEAYKKTFVDSVVKSLRDDNESDRLYLQDYAKENFCLDKLAKNWQDMFVELIENKKIDPLPPYQPSTPYRGDGKGYSDGDTRLAKTDPKRNQLKSQLQPQPQSKLKPAISIMMPTMRIGGLDVLFESLKHQTFKDFELILVDGIYKYRKEVVENLKKNYDFPVKHIEPTKNTFPVGCYCNSSNAGIVNAAADLLLIITDYTYLPADCVEKHVQFHMDNPAENLGYMCPHQYKEVPELNPDFIPYSKPLEDAERYAQDLKDGKLNHVLWSLFKEPFCQDPENLPLDSMGNADNKLFMTPGPADQNAFNGKNESMKTSAALKINGYDEDLDGTHCWQDNVFSDTLVKKLGFIWIVDPANKVYIVNPRHSTAWSKRLRPYETNLGVWRRKQATNYEPLPNNWNLSQTRDAILNNIKVAPINKLQKISVIVTTNRIGGLDVLFESLRNQSYQNFELVLVDAIYSKRKDLVAEKAKQYNFIVKHIEPNKNTFPISNYCTSMNTGLCAAEGELVYFTCDYAYLDKDTLLTHAEFHSNNSVNYALMLPVSYYGLDKDVISDKFPKDRQYGQLRTDSKYNLLVATEKEYVDAHDLWTDSYVNDLKSDLLDDILWSTFKQPFNKYTNVESYSDFNPANTNLDTRYGDTTNLVLQDMCCLKNDSFKLKFLLDANGFDETFDGTHGFQDTGLARRLHTLHSGMFNAANKGGVKVLNIRYYLEPRKIINGYRNITIIDRCAASGYQDPTDNTVTQFKRSK